MNEIQSRYDSPIINIGFRGYPINGFCYDITYNGEILSVLNFSRFDDIDLCYKASLIEYREIMKRYDKSYLFEKNR